MMMTCIVGVSGKATDRPHAVAELPEDAQARHGCRLYIQESGAVSPGNEIVGWVVRCKTYKINSRVYTQYEDAEKRAERSVKCFGVLFVCPVYRAGVKK